MSLFTSSHFASVTATGKDWREVSKNVLEQLDSIRTKNSGFNLGFLYLTDHLSDDAESILNLFKSVLGIENWVGSNGIGVCGCGEEYINEPAISAMICRFDPDDFCLFSPSFYTNRQSLENNTDDNNNMLRWQEKHDPMLVVAHADPIADQDPDLAVQQLDQMLHGFIIGGLSSARHRQVQFSKDITNNGLSGVVFADHIAVSTTISQGCIPIGSPHHVTRFDEYTILELDEEKALSVFEQDIRDFAIRTVGQDPDDILMGATDPVPHDFQSLMKGDMHAAFPIHESDQNDYMVRNIIGLDPEEGSIKVAQTLSNEDRVLFVHRDDDTVLEDLSKHIVDLRKRVLENQGQFAPKGALYFSCGGRTAAIVDNKDNSEMRLIQDIIGDIPITGFYAGGEIYNAHIHSYTGILVLFL